jgi:PKD repeat protein
VLASDKITRTPGSPNEQEVTISASTDLSKSYSGRLIFDTETAYSGGTPVWVIIDGVKTKITTFNTQKNDPSSYHQTYDFALSELVSVIGKEISFTGSATDPGADDMTFDWLFGDGGSASKLYPWDNGHSVTETVKHTYSAAGSYTVTLDVTDDDGGAGSASKTIVIS